MNESALATNVVNIAAGNTSDASAVLHIRQVLGRAFVAHEDASAASALEQLIADADDRRASLALVRTVVELAKNDAALRSEFESVLSGASNHAAETPPASAPPSTSLASTGLLSNEQLGALDACSVVSIAELAEAIDANPAAAGKLLDLDIDELAKLRASLAELLPSNRANENSEGRKRKLVTGLLTD